MTDQPKEVDSLIDLENEFKKLGSEWDLQSFWNRRLFFASSFEMTSSLTLVFIFSYVQFEKFRAETSAMADIHFGMTALLESGWVVASLIVLFFECFTFLLTSRSIIVGAAQSLVGLTLGRSWSGSTDALRIFGNSSRKESSTKVQSNDMADLFREYIGRSQKAVDVAQRRPNVLLFVGTAIAIVGLWFFIETLPQQSTAEYMRSTNDVQQPINIQIYEHLISITPRILMLLFIQVLAGFFLRQYRASMEEFRYYERILRHRESQFMSYSLRKDLGDTKSLTKFSEILMQDDNIGALKKNETTAIIQAHREEVNEFNPLVDRVLSLRRTIFKPKRSTTRKSREGND